MDPVVPESSDATTAPAQKYIRTYAGDIATVQRGGVPDLAPVPSHGTPTPPPIQLHPEALLTTYEQGMHEAAARTVAAVPATPAAREWQASEVEKSATLERLREKARGMGLPTDLSSQGSPPPYVIHEDIVVPPEPPPPPTAPLSPPPVLPPLSPPEPLHPPPPAPVVPPTPPSPARTPIAEHSGLHTYGSDVIDRVEATQASRASIIAAEQDARPSRPVAPVAREDRRYIYTGITLLLFGVGGLYAVYAYYIATGPVTLVPLVSAPIFVDERESVSGEGSTLMTAFEQSVGRPLPSGSVRLVYNPAATSSDASIFNKLNLSAPGTLLRNIDATHSMAGVVSSSGEQTPFFILSVASYGETFAGMLSWEALMLHSLAKLYPPHGAVALPASATTSTTSASAVTRTLSVPSPRAGFIDQVVANHDTRIYRDGEGRSVLIYGYWDQKTLVIARDEVALAAILDRLATSRIQ